MKFPRKRKSLDKRIVGPVIIALLIFACFVIGATHLSRYLERDNNARVHVYEEGRGLAHEDWAGVHHGG
jgi:hypothetical protein